MLSFIRKTFYAVSMICIGFVWTIDPVHADWPYTQNFDSLSAAALNGQDSWLKSGTLLSSTVTNTGTPYQGTQHVSNASDTGGSDKIFRHITTSTYGELTIALKGPASATGYLIVQLSLSTTAGPYLGLYQNNISYGAGLTTLQARTANQYYKIGIRYECTTGGFQGLSQYQAAINVDGGAWTTFAMNNNIAGIDRLDIQAYSPSSETWYFDDLQPSTSATATTDVQPYNRGNSPFTGGGSFLW